MSVKIAGIEFDRVDDDRDADVLYLHVGEPSAAVDWDESEEGHALRYGPDGAIVGITLVNARRILENDVVGTSNRGFGLWLETRQIDEAASSSRRATRATKHTRRRPGRHDLLPWTDEN